MLPQTMETYIYSGEWTTDSWHLQPKHKFELGHHNLNGSGRGKAGHQSVRQVDDDKSELQDTHAELQERK